MAAATRQSSTTTFRITPKSGIWRVTSDDRFFGDYRARQWALIGAQGANGAIESDQTLSPL